jgi:hypothetical protein
MAGTGAYAIWQSRGAAPGSSGQKRIVAGLGVGKSFYLLRFGHEGVRPPALLIGSAFRWRQCGCNLQSDTEIMFILYITKSSQGQLIILLDSFHKCVKLGFLFSTNAAIPLRNVN